jgi:hypothetical protein
MRKLFFAFLTVCLASASAAGNKRAPIEFELQLAKWKSDTGHMVLKGVIFNRSAASYDLSKAGKINVVCRIRDKKMAIPAQHIEVVNSLDPTIARLQLRPRQSVSQNIEVKVVLKPGEAAEIRGSVEIGSVCYNSKSILLRNDR